MSEYQLKKRVPELEKEVAEDDPFSSLAYFCEKLNPDTNGCEKAEKIVEQFINLITNSEKKSFLKKIKEENFEEAFKIAASYLILSDEEKEKVRKGGETQPLKAIFHNYKQFLEQAEEFLEQ